VQHYHNIIPIEKPATEGMEQLKELLAQQRKTDIA
jgi:hypothetical protein